MGKKLIQMRIKIAICNFYDFSQSTLDRMVAMVTILSLSVNILLETSSEVKDPTEFLWRHNCIIYSIATEWKSTQGKEKVHQRTKAT